MATAAMNVMAVEAEHLLQVYRRGRVVIERGRGCRLFDSDGRSYLDLISGVGVAALGHAHPRLAAAIADQASTLLHTSNLFFHPLQGEVATRLAALSGLPRAFFCNSGTEAVEACLKFARRYWHAQGTKRAGFVAFEHGFHGRSIGSLSVTWDDHYRAPFSPLLANLAYPIGFMVSPASVRRFGKTFGRHGGGTGPFRVADWQPGSAVVLERHADYWGQAPELERIVFRPLFDPIRIEVLNRAGDGGMSAPPRCGEL